MNYILNEQHGKKIAVILNGRRMNIPLSMGLTDLVLEFGDCEHTDILSYYPSNKS